MRMHPGTTSDTSGLDALVHVDLGYGENELLVMSPNVSYIPHYRHVVVGGHNPRIFDDGMCGFDEACKWPGLWNNTKRHFACVPAPPSWRRKYRFSQFRGFLSSLDFAQVDCLWDNVTPKDFTNSLVKMTHTDPDGYGFIARPVIDRISRATSYINSLCDAIIPRLPMSEERRKALKAKVQSLYLRLLDILSYIRSFDDNWIPTLFRYRELQRCNLEILGYLVLFAEVLECSKLHIMKAPGLPFPVLGAFVSLPGDMSECIRGGIPCWKIFTASSLADGRTNDIRSVNSLPITDFLSLKNFKYQNGRDLILYRDYRNNKFSEFAFKRDLVASSGLEIMLLPLPKSPEEIGENTPSPSQDMLLVPSDENLSVRLSSSSISFISPQTPCSTTDVLPSLFNPLRSQHLQTNIVISRRTSFTFKKAFGDIQVFSRDDVVHAFWLGVQDVSNMESPYFHAVGNIYAFPSPNLFNDSRGHNRGQRFIVWLSMRLMWIHSAFTANGHDIQPLSTVAWRMLTDGKKPFSKIMSLRQDSKFEKRLKAREDAQQLRETLGLGDYHASLTGDWGSKIYTASTITTEIQAEIIYELHHMNFTSDFLSLDALETRPLKSVDKNFDGKHRKNLFLSMFNHEIILDPIEVRFFDVWSLPLCDRRKALVPWFTLMMEWPSCLPSLSTQNISELDDQSFEEFERSMIRMYILFFARSFRRYPVLPIIRPLSLELRHGKWILRKTTRDACWRLLATREIPFFGNLMSCNVCMYFLVTHSRREW